MMAYLDTCTGTCGGSLRTRHISRAVPVGLSSIRLRGGQARRYPMSREAFGGVRGHSCPGTYLCRYLGIQMSDGIGFWCHGGQAAGGPKLETGCMHSLLRMDGPSGIGQSRLVHGKLIRASLYAAVCGSVACMCGPSCGHVVRRRGSTRARLAPRASARSAVPCQASVGVSLWPLRAHGRWPQRPEVLRCSSQNPGCQGGPGPKSGAPL